MDNNKKTLNFEGEELFLEVSEYLNTGNLAILAYTKEEFYGDITINLTGYSIDMDEGFINTLTKDLGLEKRMIQEGIIKKVITKARYNMGEYDLVKFDIEKLKEYDSTGVKRYEEEHEEEFEQDL